MTYDLAGVPIAFDIGGEADFRAGRPVLVPPTCSVCGSADDVLMCDGRRLTCRTRTCPTHRRICEQCGVILCLRCSEADVPAPVSEPYLCGECYTEAA